MTCAVMISVSSSAVHSWASTQGASWLCQTRAWQRRILFCSRARLETISPSVQLKTPCSGSEKSHWYVVSNLDYSN